MHQSIRMTKSNDGFALAWAEAGRGPALVKAANWLTHLEYDWDSPVWRHWTRFFAERFRFKALVMFTIAWSTLVYSPIAHWVWAAGGWLYDFGALDFAGGTVVHISSGVSALVAAIVLGRRHGFGTEEVAPHNLTYTILGAGLLWFGWFGFNAGSALAANGLAANAFVVTNTAAAMGAITWMAVTWIRDNYRAKFLSAMKAFGDRWQRDRTNVTSVAMMLGERAVRYSEGKPSIDLDAVLKAAADVERHCELHARRTARRMRMCVPQRHRFGSSAARIAASSGSRSCSRSACARIIMPGMQ